MTTLREAAQQALETMEQLNSSLHLLDCYKAFDAEVAALRAALAQEKPRRTGLPHCERGCEANAFQIEIRRLKAELAAEREGNDTLADSIKELKK